MGLANRVQPDGSFGSRPLRGAFMGNRGCLHDSTGRIRRKSASRSWITCTLRERPDWGRHPFPAPGRWTPLFFLDEAVASAAGHRPCALCRRQAYDAYRAAWARAFGAIPKATQIDATLAAARSGPRQVLAAPDLPFGAFFLWQGQPHLALDADCQPYLGDGYGAPRPRPKAPVECLTPQPTLEVLRMGWRPAMTAVEDRPAW